MNLEDLEKAANLIFDLCKNHPDLCPHDWKVTSITGIDTGKEVRHYKCSICGQTKHDTVLPFCIQKLDYMKIDADSVLANLFAKRQLSFSYKSLEKYVEYLIDNSSIPLAINFNEAKVRAAVDAHPDLYYISGTIDGIKICPGNLIPRLEVFNARYSETERNFIQNTTNAFLHEYYEGGSKPEWED